MRKFSLLLIAAATCLVSAGVDAQMRPGPKVEKTYGLGLPRDMDKLIPKDSDYPVFPLKPGQEAYADVDGYKIKDIVKQITAISLKSLDAGDQFWGRVLGNKEHDEATEFMAKAWEKLGLTVQRVDYINPTVWLPRKWEGGYITAQKSAPLLTLYPVNETVGTPAGGITADAVWLGIGTPADLVGREIKGKAAIIYSFLLPGGRSQSATVWGANIAAIKAGAAFIIDVVGIPGNGQFDPEGAPTDAAPSHRAAGGNGAFNQRDALGGHPAVPVMTLSQDEGFMLRDMIASGQKVRLHLDLTIDHLKNVKTQYVLATLPGMSNEQDFIMAHSDAMFQGAMDNASGMATAIDIARHYAAKPREQRPRTLVFFVDPDHHNTELGRDLMKAKYDWSKVAFILNCEHTSQAQLFLMNNDLEIANAINARRWYVSGSPEFQQLVKSQLRDFNVSVYTTPEQRAGGSLGGLTQYAPAFHIIDHIIYHTTLDTPELVPAVGLAYTERAFLSIIDKADKMTLAQIRGNKPLPNPLGGPPDGTSFGSRSIGGSGSGASSGRAAGAGD